MRLPYELLELLALEYKRSDIELLHDQRKAMLEKGLISEEEKDYLDEYITECYYGSNEDDWDEASTKEDYLSLLDKEIWGVKNLDRVNWVATDKNGSIFAYEAKPYKNRRFDIDADEWVDLDEWVEGKFCIDVTEEQSIKLCGCVPKWSDDEPTPVLIQENI